MEIFFKSNYLNKELNIKDIFLNLKTRFIGNRLIYKYCVDSTNDVAKRYLKRGLSKNGDVFLADEQIKGRGRKNNRIWESGKMQNVILSILISNFDFILSSPLITLIVGIAIMDVLKEVTSLDVKVKWPNDVFINNKKVSGILCEMVHFEGSNNLIIGIGINVNSYNFSRKIRETSTSLYLEKEKYFSREDIISKILNRLESCLIKDQFNIEKFIKEYKKNCISINREIVFVDKEGEDVYGKIIDISNYGELIVKTGNGTVSINSTYNIRYLDHQDYF